MEQLSFLLEKNTDLRYIPLLSSDRCKASEKWETVSHSASAAALTDPQSRSGYPGSDDNPLQMIAFMLDYLRYKAGIFLLLSVPL